MKKLQLYLIYYSNVNLCIPYYVRTNFSKQYVFFCFVSCLPFKIPFLWGPNGDRCSWDHGFKGKRQELHYCHLEGGNMR